MVRAKVRANNIKSVDSFFLYGNKFTLFEEEIFEKDYSIYTILDCNFPKDQWEAEYNNALFKFQLEKGEVASALDFASNLLKWSIGDGFNDSSNNIYSIPKQFFMNSHIYSRVREQRGVTAMGEYIMVDYDDTLKTFTGYIFANFPVTSYMISEQGNKMMSSSSLVKCSFSNKKYMNLLFKGKHTIKNAASFLQNYADNIDIKMGDNNG